VIFDEKTLRKLDRLALAASQVRAGQIKGERRSLKRGTSIEFADYRDYTCGDDLRRVDWNVYARLERPYIKLLEEEEDLAVHILLDASRSMDYGTTSDPHGDSWNKFGYAQRVAAALGYIALAAGDRLTLVAVRGEAPTAQFGPARGRGHTMPLLKFLQEQPTGGNTNLDAALRRYTLGPRRAGLLFLISDLFSPAGYRDGLRQLQSRGYEIVVLHVLAPDEIDPPLAGDLRLIDAETGSPQDVTLDNTLRELYRKRVSAWCQEIEAHCLKRGMHYVAVSTGVDWDEMVLRHFRQRGLIK
jgi:uncharacterized protein (DUF58 family)